MHACKCILIKFFKGITGVYQQEDLKAPSHTEKECCWEVTSLSSCSHVVLNQYFRLYIIYIGIQNFPSGACNNYAHMRIYSA